MAVRHALPRGPRVTTRAPRYRANWYRLGVMETGPILAYGWHRAALKRRLCACTAKIDAEKALSGAETP